MSESRILAARRNESLRESTAPPTAAKVDNSAGRYPTKSWEVAYSSVSRQGTLTAHRVAICVPAGLDRVCFPVPLGQPGCIYAVRRWGFALRPSALDAAGFDPTPWLAADNDAEWMKAFFRAAAFELPGEFIIASPEHPFRLVASDGLLRGSSIQWRTYLGALAFFASGGLVDADLIRFWAEAKESYHQAVDVCLAVIHSSDPQPLDMQPDAWTAFDR